MANGGAGGSRRIGPLGPTDSKIGGAPYAPVGAELPSGEPFWLDPRDASDPPLSLLQLDSDDNVAWGDLGIGHWFIREADLRACDFSRVEYHWDCC